MVKKTPELEEVKAKSEEADLTQEMITSIIKELELIQADLVKREKELADKEEELSKGGVAVVKDKDVKALLDEFRGCVNNLIERNARFIKAVEMASGLDLGTGGKKEEKKEGKGEKDEKDKKAKNEGAEETEDAEEKEEEEK